MSAVLQHVALRALAPLDWTRAHWLRLVGPWTRPLLRVRSQRVAVQATLLASLALALALRVPLWLLSWCPLLLGVPHLVADARYLLVRQGLSQRRLWCAAVLPCLLGSVLLPGRGLGTAAIAASVLLARGSHLRRAAAAIGCGLVALWARRAGPHADVLFAHAHNLVAIGCWAAWARGTRWQLAPALAICAFGCWLVLSGTGDGLLFRTSALAGGRYVIDAGSLVASLSPTDDPLWGLRWTACFAFMQSVHYGVWLRSLPDEDRARPGVRSFQSSYRALTTDLGRWLAPAAALVVCGLCIAALSFNVELARNGYLRLAFFHGPLELAVIALLWIEGRKPARAG